MSIADVSGLRRAKPETSAIDIVFYFGTTLLILTTFYLQYSLGVILDKHMSIDDHPIDHLFNVDQPPKEIV